MLGQRVDAVAVPGRPPRHRADVHHVGDVARVVTSSVKEVGHGRVRAVEQTKHVDLHHPLPLLQRRAGRRAEQHHPGVVDERVETAQFGHGLLNRRGGLLLVSDVGLQHQRGTALLTDARGQVSSLSFRRAASATAAPWAASAVAAAAPIPLDARSRQGDDVIRTPARSSPASLVCGPPASGRRPAGPPGRHNSSQRSPPKPSHTRLPGPSGHPGPMSYAGVRSQHWQLPGTRRRRAPHPAGNDSGRRPGTGALVAAHGQLARPSLPGHQGRPVAAAGQQPSYGAHGEVPLAA